MTLTAMARTKFIRDHDISDILDEFPVFRLENQVGFKMVIINWIGFTYSTTMNQLLLRIVVARNFSHTSPISGYLTHPSPAYSIRLGPWAATTDRGPLLVAPQRVLVSGILSQGGIPLMSYEERKVGASRGP